jgi:RecA-family ATPase
MTLEHTGSKRRPQRRNPRPTDAPLGGRLEFRRASEIKKKEVMWLWDRYIPRGMLTMLTGDPQAGKSTLVCEILAAISAGRPLPGEGEQQPKTQEASWYLRSEDEAGSTIVWRLENQQADMVKVLITDVKVELDEEALDQLEATIRSEVIAIVVIDTLTTWMGSDIDMNSANQSMSWLEKLKAIGQQTGCAFVLVRHRRKSNGKNDLHSGSGSIGFTAAVRSELMAKVEKNGTRTLERTKGNIGKPPPVIEYTIENSDDANNVHGVLKWVKVTAQMKRRLKHSTRMALDLIGPGGLPLNDWRSSFERAGISKGTPDSIRKAFDRARSELLAAGSIEISGEMVRRREIQPTAP